MQNEKRRRIRSPKEKRERNLERMKEMNPAEVLDRAYEYAIFCLGRRERSKYEIAEKLKAMGYSDAVTSVTVQTLVDRNFVNDGRLTEMYVRQYVRQSRGFRYVQLKLKMKGLELSEAEFRRIAGESDAPPELTQAIEWIARRYPDYASDLREKKKAMEALIRRGFSFDTAKKAVSEKNPSEI